MDPDKRLRVKIPADKITKLDEMEEEVEWARQESAMERENVLGFLKEHFQASYLRSAGELYPYFQEALNDPNEEVQRLAREALIQISNDHPDLLETLSKK